MRRIPWRRLAGCALAYGGLFALAAGAGLYFRFACGDSRRTCVVCHEIRGAQARMAKAPHRDVDCKACHGSTLEALGDNVSRGWRHLFERDHTRLDAQFCLNERQVEEVNARCAKCHAAEAAQWAASGHGKPASVFLQDEKHNRAWKPADHCLRCHGMFLEGDIEKQVARTDLGSRHAVPCTACHRMHAEDSLQLYSRSERTSFPAKHLYLQKIVTADGKPVKRSPDAANRLCVNCHAANAEGIAGSSDDRTPLGAQEGMSCTDCHKGHGRKADPARGRCPLKPRPATP